MPEGTIAEGGKAQLLVGPDVSRRGLSLQNNSSGDLRLGVVTGPDEPSSTIGIKIAPGAYYEVTAGRYAGGSWKLWGATTGQAFGWEVW